MAPNSASSTSSIFQVKEHVIACHHIREDFARTNVKDGADWRMVVKEYIPLDNLEPREGDVTILAAPALSYPKELYEPLWEDLYHILPKRDVKIKAIWIADPSNMGASSKLNKHLLYDSVNSFDHSRDLYNVISTHPSSFTQPIIGIGHSIGATQLTFLSLFHPSLFTSLILLDPILPTSPSEGGVMELITYTLTRKTQWESKQDAERYFRRGLRKWDERVLKKWLKYGIEPLDGKGGGVKLAIGNLQDLMSYLQLPHIHSTSYIPSPPTAGTEHPSPPEPPTIPKEKRKKKQAATFPQSNLENNPLIYAQSPLQPSTFLSLISPQTLILTGSSSPSARPSVLATWRETFASNPLFQKPWNGYQRNVEVESMHGGGHFFPFEDPRGTAERVGRWIGEVVSGSGKEGEGEGEGREWRRRVGRTRRWRGLGESEKMVETEEWMRRVKSKL